MKKFFVALPELPEQEQERLQSLGNYHKLKYKITDIKVKLGDKVEYNQILASFSVFVNGEVSVWKDKIKSRKSGKIKRVSVSVASKVRPGYDIIVYPCTDHL